MLAFDFPLTSLGDGVVAMVLPIGMSILAVVGSVGGFKARASRPGLVVAALSWVALFTILGEEGFRYLF